MSEEKKQYTPPEISRIKLEDNRVVAMNICKTGIDDEACAQQQIQLFQFSAS